MLRKFLIGFVLFSVVVTAAVYALDLEPKQNSASNTTKVASAAPAPQFTAMDMQGKLVTLESLKGKPVFLNFWATWCPPCVQEMPHIQAMYEKYGDKMHFVVLNADASKEEVIEFMTEKGYKFPTYLNHDNNSINAYGIQSIPATFIIDAQGNLVKSEIGGLSKAQMESAIKAAL